MGKDFMKEFTYHVQIGDFDRWIERIIETAEYAVLNNIRGNKADPEFYLALGEAGSELIRMAEGLEAMRSIKAAYRLPDYGGKCISEEFKLFYSAIEQLKEGKEIKEMLGKEFKKYFVD